MRNDADIPRRHRHRTLERLNAIDRGSACVLLRHELSGGSWHVDWLLAPAVEDAHASQPPPEGRDLVTLRLPDRLDELAAGAQMPAEPIGLHRRAYLEFEGEVSGGRGRVDRVARGEIERIARDGESVLLVVRWRDAGTAAVLRQALTVRAEGESNDSTWIVRCVSREIEAQ